MMMCHDVIPMLKVFKNLENLCVGLKPHHTTPRSSGSVGFFLVFTSHQHTKHLQTRSTPTFQPPATFKPALHLPFSPLKTLKPSPSLANRKSMPYPSIQTARNPVIPYILALQLPSNPVIPYLPALPISTLYL